MSDGGPAGVAIGPATVDDVDPITDLWIALAEGQRRHGSALLAEGNRSAVREWVARSVVTGEVLVARTAADGEVPVARMTAEDDHDLIGFVAFSLDRGGYDRDRTRGTVSNLYVVPERRGEEIGSELLRAAERALREAGAETIALEALADNERARAFYAAHGYEPHRVELTKSVSATGEIDGDDDTRSRDDID